MVREIFQKTTAAQLETTGQPGLLISARSPGALLAHDLQHLFSFSRKAFFLCSFLFLKNYNS
jgi:hypothetical protein